MKIIQARHWWHHIIQGDEEHEVTDSEVDDKPSYDELQSSFNELHGEFPKLSKKFKTKENYFKSRK